MATADPLTQVYDAIWSLLAANDSFTSYVKEGNRIGYSGAARDPEKTNVQAADLPEVRVTPHSGGYGDVRDTARRSWVERYEITINTGDRRVDRLLYPVRWAVVQALANWETILQALTWQGTAFVYDADLLDANVGSSEIDIKRGIDGWAAVATFEVQMHFTHANLKGS